MKSSKFRVNFVAAIVSSVVLLQGCGKSAENEKTKVEIKPATQITNDATVYAQQAWILINQVDPLLYENATDRIQAEVRDPVRQLILDWRINVKMTDSVTEGKYALCRKALTSIDSWARTLVEKEGQEKQRQANYERDKQQCKTAVDNPELGNTKAYTNLF